MVTSVQKKVKVCKKGLQGEITIPSDKSISHRAVMFSTLAPGKSTIKNFSCGQDPLSSLEVCQTLGVKAEFISQNTLELTAPKHLLKPSKELYCGNSGTTMRLMSGILAGQKFTSVLTGDESLSKRPMKRIIEPLEFMGADILSHDFKAPLKITGQPLKGISYESKLASAQVKSCVLLAGLNAEGVTTYTEPYLSRNHTEIMLKYMNADIETYENTVSIKKSKLEPVTFEIPGDISSAAYFIAAGLIVPNSKIILRNIGLNPARTGILDAVKLMGAEIKILDKRTLSGELTGDIEITSSDLKACTIEGALIPRLIDEIPVIALLASQAEGTTIIKDAQDLRNKESDRIKTVADALRKLGANIEEREDGFIIEGKTPLKGGVSLDTYNDHRLAMTYFIAGLISQKETVINGFEWAAVSFPEFEELFSRLGL